VHASSALIPVGEGDHALGAEQPALTLVEYGDFGCPFCFAASRPVKSLLDRYDGLRLVWRHFPDPDLHPGADLAAELSEAAAESGRFWEAHSMLLGGRESFPMPELLSVAERLELDRQEVETALAEHRYVDRVQGDIEGGRKAGVHATPTFFLDGEPLRGPWRRLAKVVPALLEERGLAGGGSEPGAERGEA
jgi:protein-disulfide isomerase